jgi:hypothetical protein
MVLGYTYREYRVAGGRHRFGTVTEANQETRLIASILTRERPMKNQALLAAMAPLIVVVIGTIVGVIDLRFERADRPTRDRSDDTTTRAIR